MGRMCARLVAILDISGLTDREVSARLGYTGQATIGGVRRAETFPDTERLGTFGRMLIRGCAHPNLHWILTGEGKPVLPAHRRGTEADAVSVLVLAMVER